MFDHAHHSIHCKDSARAGALAGANPTLHHRALRATGPVHSSSTFMPSQPVHAPQRRLQAAAPPPRLCSPGAASAAAQLQACKRWQRWVSFSTGPDIHPAQCVAAEDCGGATMPSRPAAQSSSEERRHTKLEPVNVAQLLGAAALRHLLNLLSHCGGRPACSTPSLSSAPCTVASC